MAESGLGELIQSVVLLMLTVDFLIRQINRSET